jgi:hypothetical protein
MPYAETYERLAADERRRDRTTPLGAARAAFLEAGKPSLSIRKRTVLPKDDLDERIKAAIDAFIEVSGL